MYKGIKNIHFVGVGGIGMSGIAELLLNLGYHVSGSDVRSIDITRRLAGLGATIRKGHAPENVGGAEVVVTSSAVRADNVEVVEARKLGIPVIPRAEMLAELMRLKYGIAVAGAHGKTTTTSMVAQICAAGNLDPTVVIGGKVKSLGSNARLGQGDFLVAEADESDGSFLMLTPTIACVTNIDAEHLDYYSGGMDQIRASFLNFVNRVPFYGVAVLNLDDPNLQGLIPHLKKRLITYGLTAQADVRAVDIKPVAVVGGLVGSSYQLLWKDAELVEVKLAAAGRHNVYNSLAAAAVALELDVAPQIIAQALGAFEGVDRRMQVKGEAGGVIVVDDYGHHPTEVRATLSALAACFPGRRRVILFQPHRFSRTKALYSEFCTAFNDADCLVVTDIYPASEPPLEGVTGEWLLTGLKACGHKDVAYVEKPRLADGVLSRLREGDVFLTLGAGDVWQVGEEVLGALSGRGLLVAEA